MIAPWSPIATATTYDDKALSCLAQLVDGVDYIFECIRRMGKIDNSSGAILSHYRFEATTYGAQHTQVGQYLLLLETEQECCTIDGQ